MALFFKAPITSTACQYFKTPLLISSISTTTPRKPLKRRNYLRRKLLKTVTPPYPNLLIPESPHKNPVVLIEPSNDQVVFGGGGVELEKVDIQGTKESALMTSVGNSDSIAKIFSEVSIFKFGLWLIGAFVFQTVCAVWILGSADFDDENGQLRENDDEDGNFDIGLKKNYASNSGVVLNDDVDVDKKIEEIQMMARNARERERLERRNNKVEGDDNQEEEEEEEEDDDFVESGIEKEVRDRLIKMRQRLGKGHRSLSIDLEGSIEKELDIRNGVDKNGLSREDGNAALTYEEYEMRKSSSGLNDKSKGNPEEVKKDMVSDNYMDEGISVSSVDSFSNAHKLDLHGADLINLPMSLEEDRKKKRAQRLSKSSKTTVKRRMKIGGRENLAKKAGFGKSDQKGLAQDVEEGRLINEASKDGESNVFEISTIDSKDNALKGNESSSKGQLFSEVELDKAGHDTGFWWSRLPFVLVIFMSRAIDGEGQRGLFTLRNSYDVDDTTSLIVAFEDHGDASNFCYVLKTFFEDLEDFFAEVVPLTTKELLGVIKSYHNRVLVVRKGQLKLYAGQPLPDAEAALRSLVGQP